MDKSDSFGPKAISFDQAPPVILFDRRRRVAKVGRMGGQGGSFRSESFGSALKWLNSARGS